MHAPAWALAIGVAWGALAGELPDIDHRRAGVSRTGVSLGVVGALLGVPVRIVGMFIRGLRVKHRGPTHSLTCLALWAAIAAPLYMACGSVMVLALAWAVGNWPRSLTRARPCTRRRRCRGYSDTWPSCTRTLS